MKKTIKIACKGADTLDIREMTYFQGDLKTLTKENYEKLKKEIVETGYAYPIKIWTDTEQNKRFICGGHQTYRVLTQMRNDGYDIPSVPIVDIYAKDFFEAKRRVLQDITQYGTVERQGLYEFSIQANIPIEDLQKSFVIPQFSLDMESFRKEFFDDNISPFGTLNPSIAPQSDLNQEYPDEPKEEEEDEPEDDIPLVIEPRVKKGEHYKIAGHELFNGDCLKVLKTFADESIDSLVTDPPAGISFMGKEWDEDKGGSKEWTAWLCSVMKECLRVMKPGAHGLVWAIPRTSHWTATALEDAGFEIRDVVTHIFGSGFPKSHNIEKATGDIRFKGFGTALKPASEHWVLVRKPISEKTVAANTLKHGTGGINIDESRIGYDSQKDAKDAGTHSGGGFTLAKNFDEQNDLNNDRLGKSGRFPANLVLSHNDDCVEVGVKKVKSKAGITKSTSSKGWKNTSLQVNQFGHGNEDGTETVSAFECTPDCAVAELDRQSGISKSNPDKRNEVREDSNTYGKNLTRTPNNLSDSGGASRFFYCAKPSKREKNEGCGELEEKGVRRHGDRAPDVGRQPQRELSEKNHHPTVKSTKLMSYLINMVTPPDGTLLDCFGGSGTTMVSAHLKGFSSILIEQSPEYCDIILARAEHVTKKSAELTKEKS